MPTNDTEGSFYFLASRNRWMCAYTDVDGKRKTRVATPNTERGAAATLRREIARRDAGEGQGRTVTLASYATSWLEAKRVAGCRPRTIETYRDRLETYALPTLGKVRLDKLAAPALERLYGALLDRGLSPTTVASVHGTLRALLNTARRRRLVGQVVTSLIEPPRRTAYEARTLTVAEARELLAMTRAHPRYGPLWAFMLGTGCRFGEAVGLTWDNVNLDTATATICQQATRVRDPSQPPLRQGKRGRTVMALSPVKTDAGRRDLYLAPFVVAALRRQQALVTAMRSAAPQKWSTQYPNLVFPGKRGGLLPENVVQGAWHPALVAAGLEGRPGQAPLRMHDLRHTRGTLMADAGEDTTVIQRTLGHARQSITADLYIGRVPKALRASAERYGDLIDPNETIETAQQQGGDSSP